MFCTYVSNKRLSVVANIGGLSMNGWMLCMTKNPLMVTDHSKDVPEILPLYRRSEIDFPPHFLVRLMHSFPMMYNTI